jgi:hypothetical protein
MDPLAIAGLGIGLIGGIGGMFGAAKSNRQLDALLKQDPAYKANPLVAQRLGLANTLLNARAPGAAAAERNIYQNQANTQANVNRNATDSSQALALAAAGQGQTNQAFSNLETQETQDYQRRYGNLVGAQDASVQEGDKVYQDQIRRFQDMAQIRGAQAHNRSSAWSSLSNFGMGAMSLGLMGGSSMFGSGGGGGMPPPAGSNDPTNYMRGRSLNMPLLNYGSPNTSNIYG